MQKAKLFCVDDDKSGEYLDAEINEQRCESPSEKTILDVLGLQSASKNYIVHHQDSQLEQRSFSRSSPILLVLTNNHTDQGSSNIIVPLNQSDGSFSTNKFLHNFLEEKQRQLEARQEDDNESDTTE